MSWTDQNPPADTIILHFRHHKVPAGFLEIDQLADGTYRLTVGDLFGSQELGRGKNLPTLLREHLG